MRQLSPTGRQTINYLAQQHGFSPAAVSSMLESLINGNGSMAQFNHPEFGGSGQWMKGGMTMVSDMFNDHLKDQINQLCSDLSRLVANETDLIGSGSFQSQRQGNQQQDHFGGDLPSHRESGPGGTVSLFVPPAPGSSGDWWPGNLGWPSTIGAQNNVRYAYFAQARRLAIEVNGKIAVYDTLDHRIGGFSQQQSHGGSLTFSSQHGVVDVTTLPVISADGVPQQPSSRAASASSPVQQDPVTDTSNAEAADVFVTIEKLAALCAKGILTEDEFATKKAELLGRL